MYGTTTPDTQARKYDINGKVRYNGSDGERSSRSTLSECVRYKQPHILHEIMKTIKLEFPCSNQKMAWWYDYVAVEINKDDEVIMQLIV